MPAKVRVFDRYITSWIFSEVERPGSFRETVRLDLSGWKDTYWVWTGLKVVWKVAFRGLLFCLLTDLRTSLHNLL